MILVFILCTIVIIITLLISMIILSTLRIKVTNLELSNMQENQKFKINLKVYLYLFNHIKWLRINLDNKKVKKIYNKIKLSNIDFKKLEKDFKLKDINKLKQLEPKFAYFNLDFNIGVEDVILTSFAVFLISTILSIILPYTIKKYNENNYKYKIEPLYMNKNV